MRPPSEQLEKALKGDLPSIRFVAEVEQTFAIAVAKERADQMHFAAQDLPSESETEVLAHFAEAARSGRWRPAVGAADAQDEVQQDD